MSIDNNADAGANADRRNRAYDDDDNAPLLAQRSGGWIQFTIVAGRLCKSKSSECSTWSTDSMTTSGNDTATSGSNDNDTIFKLVAKSSRED